MAARERKKTKPVKPPASRRSGKVTIVKAAKRTTKSATINAAWKYPYQKPKGLSVEARWMELKPEGWNMLDWFRLFDPNEDLWESLWAEAYESTLEGSPEGGVEV